MMSELSIIFFQLNAPVACFKLCLGKPGLVCSSVGERYPPDK